MPTFLRKHRVHGYYLLSTSWLIGDSEYKDMCEEGSTSITRLMCSYNFITTTTVFLLVMLKSFASKLFYAFA